MSDTLADAYAAAAAAVRVADRVVIATHENPDGDALGSLVGTLRGLRDAGVDAVAVTADAPLPREYRWLVGDELRHACPDGSGWLLLAVDCGSGARVAAPAGVVERAASTVNIDHHHDNTRFGDIDVVDAQAACAAMMVRELLRLLGGSLTLETATALYVGLVTDTGRFQYSNTDERAFAFAAELVALGVQPHRVFSAIYEHVPPAKLRLLGVALGRIETRLAGTLALTWVTRDDIEAARAEEAASEGVIDQLRALEGVEVAALIREPATGPRHKVSLRSATGAVDVSAIARAGGGGGHPRAAGFSSDLDRDQLIAFIEREVASRGG